MKLNYPLSPKARKNGAGWLDICPAHDDRCPSLSINVGDDGKLLMHCFAGCSFESIISAADLSKSRPSTSVTQSELEHARAQRIQQEARKIAYCDKLWKQGQAIEGTLSQEYLVSRNIKHWSTMQRHHPGLRYPETGEKLPVLMTAVQRNGRLVGLHRTFLNHDGTKRNKLMLGSCKGGAAHLIGCTGPLLVAEGIETTLSLPALHETSEGRYWSALSANGLISLELPKQPSQLIIAADGDQAGLSAANALGQRAAGAGWNVLLMPAPEGRDWNDVLMEECNDRF